jgi:hypothetical protein
MRRLIFACDSPRCFSSVAPDSKGLFRAPRRAETGA